MAESSNRRTSDLSRSIHNCCNPHIGHRQSSCHGCSVTTIAADTPEIHFSEAREKHYLSDMAQGYRTANSRNQFDEAAHENAARSHAACCQHSSCGYVCCTSLPFLNSPFQPTEPPCNNQASTPNSIEQIDMQRNTNPTRSVRISRQYTTPLSLSPGNRTNFIPQYANMRSLEQQSTPFRSSVTPTLSHSSTPQSVFSRPQVSPNTPYDWGTPATTAGASFKEPDISQAVDSYAQSEIYEVSRKGIDKISQELDAHFTPDAGNSNQQWLQDAELDDLNYRRGSQSAAVQLQDQYELFESGETIEFAEPATLTMFGHDKHVPNHDCVQSAYGFSQPDLSQQYFPVDQRGLNNIDVEFNDPFAPSDVINPYDTHATYNQIDAYGTFGFNGPLYQNVSYPPLPAVIPPNDFTLQGNGKQVNRGGPSRSRHNGRDDDLDKKLVEWRDQGMSYKEIMAKGNFGLEESTLRGRYRTLTKSKEKRLRKPVWDDHAISALLEAVEHHAPAGSKSLQAKESLDKIPWKRVAEWMEKERKCYLYGNATVKKKYTEVIRARRHGRRQTTV